MLNIALSHQVCGHLRQRLTDSVASFAARFDRAVLSVVSAIDHSQKKDDDHQTFKKRATAEKDEILTYLEVRCTLS